MGGPEDSIFGSAKNADPTAKFSYATFIARFVAGHVFAYPLAFLWAVATMPIVMHLNFNQLEAMAHDEKALSDHILRHVAWPAGFVFALLHLCALVWALAQKYPRSHWAFFGGFGVILGSGVLLGAGSWIWLFTR